MADDSKGPKKLVPVTNKETGRTVYVLPESLKKDPDKFERVRPDKAGDPRWRGKPKPPRKPAVPQKPEIPRDPPPAPVKARPNKKPADPTKAVKPVKEVKPTKPSKPSDPHRWKRLKRLMPKAATVVQRYLRLKSF